MLLYKSREFCRASNCIIQEISDKEIDVQKIKSICRAACVRTAYDFHKWLKENDYIIVKRPDDFKIIETDVPLTGKIDVFAYPTDISCPYCNSKNTDVDKTRIAAIKQGNNIQYNCRCGGSWSYAKLCNICGSSLKLITNVDYLSDNYYYCKKCNKEFPINDV